MLSSMIALIGQCRPSGTMNGYANGIRIAKMNGEKSLIDFSRLASPAPVYTPIGPITNAVSGSMTSMDRKGTKISWTFSG